MKWALFIIMLLMPVNAVLIILRAGCIDQHNRAVLNGRFHAVAARADELRILERMDDAAAKSEKNSKL
jgi:hypothetical protein